MTTCPLKDAAQAGGLGGATAGNFGRGFQFYLTTPYPSPSRCDLTTILLSPPCDRRDGRERAIP